MPISEAARTALAASCLLALAACDPATLAGNPTRTTVSVAGAPVSVAAPPGFCIDRRSLRSDEAGAFVLMSDCALLAGDGARVRTGAALTASISAGGLGGEGDDAVQGLSDLAAFVATGEARALLGRSGQAAGVRVLATEARDDVFYVLVEDRGRQPIPGVESRFWRAFLEIDDRMVALSVLGFEGAGIDAQQGLDLVAAAAGAMRRGNGV